MENAFDYKNRGHSAPRFLKRAKSGRKIVSIGPRQQIYRMHDFWSTLSGEFPQVVFELGQQQDEVTLSVSNQGPPVPGEVLDMLFVGLISARPGKENRPHLGIGLYIANRIAQQHQGELKVTNLDDGEGVKVSLILPCEERGS